MVHSTRKVFEWNEFSGFPGDSTAHAPVPQAAASSVLSMLKKAVHKRSFFDRIGMDVDVLKAVLLLTGAVHFTKQSVDSFTQSLLPFSWLWMEDADDHFHVSCAAQPRMTCLCPLTSVLTVYILNFQEFLADSPQLEDYEPELMKFAAIELQVEAHSSVHSVGPIGLDTSVFCSQLRQLVNVWRHKYSDRLHAIAQVHQLTQLSCVSCFCTADTVLASADKAVCVL